MREIDEGFGTSSDRQRRLICDCVISLTVPAHLQWVACLTRTRSPSQGSRFVALRAGIAPDWAWQSPYPPSVACLRESSQAHCLNLFDAIGNGLEYGGGRTTKAAVTGVVDASV